jgi:DNA-binding LytR/AlgR family response regulator
LGQGTAFQAEMTSASISVASQPWQGGSDRDESGRMFWLLQVAWWSAYGMLLMVPWMGRYPILVMLPNKAVVGGTGLLATALLRLGYRHLMASGRPVTVLFGAIAVGSIVGGIAWSTASAWILGGRAADQLVTLGTLASGVPALAGASYHALVLAAWSLAYVSVVMARQRASRRAPRPRSIIAATPSIQDKADVLVRDGRRTLRIALDEIDWIRAEGDYVRLHLARRSLLVRDTMSRLSTGLGRGLVRIHRSTIVNVARVRETVSLPNRELEVTLHNGVRLRASRTYADGLRAALGAGATEDNP